MDAPTSSCACPPLVAAVTMGYGHLRAAAALADHWRVPVTLADRPPLVSPLERRVWTVARRGYHDLSRWSQGRLRGSVFEPMLERITAIDPDTGLGAGLPVRLLDVLIRLGLGRRLGRELDRRGAALVATFYANAIAAAHHGTAPVALVVTDSDIHRIWAPRDPARSRIDYLAPTDAAVRRLAGYGVPAERIYLTGFPLPGELVGSPALERLDDNLAARRRRLAGGSGPKDGALRLVFTVGGAGAHVGTGRQLLVELAEELRLGRLRLVLAAGCHDEIARRFRRWRRTLGLDELPPSRLEILHSRDFTEMYRRFNAALANADVLWTKPSEMVFYGALGLPLVLEPAIGDHEARNRDMALAAGVACDRPRPGELGPWVARQLADGWFARAAELGRQRLEARGTHNVAAWVSRKLNSGFTRH